ncbi:hypothetical protein HMPREF0201_04866 [Cedecea davisae DSM 4568]|uniref:Uncharacterized protein n=1 Tax=Cedecea davisae DSM 4568 TaxID=566551 RepID=S3JGI7_9ENTR|nr:hypothetical protein HMPREF0201_04866 [Cedecea davisae DSM 4568]
MKQITLFVFTLVIHITHKGRSAWFLSIARVFCRPDLLLILAIVITLR